MNSKLKEIINRLEKIVQTDEDNRTRRFRSNGEDVCEVNFNVENNMFTFVDYKRQQQYEFDNIDLVAIEVFETL
ncbi:DUF1797 family protein [Atopobacter phocae]|uniref:DUF1797 family protein n=1 Tax=Atopobacter phocae TaxID=136492 RepID=UPI0004B5E4AE|nr:DUF1797 family protein [Atopobacter phocae]